jgi:hypothetical protein
MLEYFTIAACFIDFADKNTKLARQQIDEALTKDVVKAGWTYPNSLKALDILGDAAVNRVRGTFRSVKTHVNKDARTGNEYPKIRVELERAQLIKSYKDENRTWQERPSTTRASDDGSVIITLDASQEAAHRLVAKLSAVKPGQVVTITPFAEAVERDGRTFVNHIISLRDGNGAEITSGVDYFTQFREKTRALEAELEKLQMDKRSIKDQVKRKKTHLFMDLADELGKDLPPIVPTKGAGASKETAEQTHGKASSPASSGPVSDSASQEPLW